MDSQETNIFSLSKQDTLALKGIAILAMLCHHLYGWPPNGVEAYSGFLLWIGELGKVCVALFLFCSGYGLAKQYVDVEGIKDTIRFMCKRLIKFYANYWVVFLIFVPIGVWVFHRPLSAAYGEQVNIVKRLVLDIMGVQGYQSYNITWWFNQLILTFYILFPLLYKIAHRVPWLSLLVSIAIIPVTISMPYVCKELCSWQFPFLLGIVWAQNEIKLKSLFEQYVKNKYLYYSLLTIIFVGLVVLRQYHIIPNWDGIHIDGFLAGAIALCWSSFPKKSLYATKALEFIGKHSMNIYMIHTFFNRHWFSHWLHTSEWMRGGGNFILLTIICLLISIGIEFLKEKCGLYKFEEKIIERI